CISASTFDAAFRQLVTDNKTPQWPSLVGFFIARNIHNTRGAQNSHCAAIARMKLYEYIFM
ncbi:MAG: hypothetical protein K2X80_10710, partial [Pseudomonadaceae bacterium]|nr:hypothetical protein [Pseudomonadaceae bacterium]